MKIGSLSLTRRTHWYRAHSIRLARLGKADATTTPAGLPAVGGLPKLVISFSLYGAHPIFLSGAIANAAQYSSMFPGWDLWFYVGDSVPESVLAELAAFPAVSLIDRRGRGVGPHGMSWRFEAALEDGVEIALFRDVDSRPQLRERAAVDLWLASGRDALILRDHVAHNRRIMGGMWGVRASRIRGALESLAAPPRWTNYGDDQYFLEQFVYPSLTNSMLVFDDDRHFPDEDESRWPWPASVRRTQSGFVGAGFDEFGKLRVDHGAV